MQIENTAIRLKELMEERNLRQVDLLNMVKPYCEKYDVKMNKSDISQYLAGTVKPGQEKLSMLGMALNINESWLMGYDVPKEKTYYNESNNLTKEEKLLLDNYNKLNNLGKREADKRIAELTEISKYTNTIYLKENEHLMPLAAHEKKGDFSEEDKKHDIDLMKNDTNW